MIKKFNINDFVTTEDWTMKAIFLVDGHWVEGILEYKLKMHFLKVYDFRSDTFESAVSEIIDKITNYIVLE